MFDTKIYSDQDFLKNTVVIEKEVIWNHSHLILLLFVHIFLDIFLKPQRKNGQKRSQS